LDRSIPQSQRKSITQFRKELFDTWGKIGPEVIQKLIELISRRLQAAVEAKGGITRY